MKNRTFKLGTLIMALAVSCSMAAGFSAAEAKEAAIATLRTDEGTAVITVDLSDGWAVEFTSGAFYLYQDGYAYEKEANAIGMLLAEEVYGEYLEEAEASESRRELDSAIVYTPEDLNETFYLFTTEGEKAFLLLDVINSDDSDAVFARIKAEDEPYDEQTENTFVSDLYSDEEMVEAIMVVTAEFITWDGCEMTGFRYAGDDACTEENLKWLNELAEGKNYTQCIEFITDFHSPVEEADLEGTAWEPDTDYNDYQWWLAREDGGEWELITWGY